MSRYAASAVLVLAVFTAPALGHPYEAFAQEFDFHALHQEEFSPVTAPTSLNETRFAAAVETQTSVSLEPIPPSEFSSNGTDANGTELYDDATAEEIVARFFEINARAAGDPAFQRREVQVLSCCYAKKEEACVIDCFNHFVESFDGDGAASNATTTVLLCGVLYGLLGCEDENDTDRNEECMDYCRCYNSDPWVEGVWGVMSALFFVCMLLTLAVYACVPRLRNLHGKCLISYLVAVIAGEAVSTVSLTLVCGDPNPVATAIANYLSVVRYCWVNVLCINVYCTCQPFQSVRQQPRTGSFSQERRKLLCFSAATWGGSALVYGLLMAFQVESTPIVYAGIIALLLVSSCVPLILTLARIWRTKRQTKKNCLNISKMKLNWFYLTSKLLCLSGAGKLFSLVLYFTLRGKPYYNWMFVVLKLEGPLMLFMFVWNVRVRGLVRQRLSTLEWISVEKSNNI